MPAQLLNPCCQSPQFALVKTCQKCLDLPAKASYLVFKSRRMRRKPIDYDALLKEFISDFFPDFIAFVNPALYAAIDWEKGYVFLEQELINALRGKFKIKGKSKRTDKLVKVVLKEGKEHFVFVHIEFQHKPEKGFARRMYIYRTLICLRYDIDDISAIAIFTANPPPEEEKSYRNDTFGTSII